MSNQQAIGIGLVGIGRAGWGMHTEEVQGLPDKFRFVAACDVEADRRQAMAERFGATPYARIEELVADPRVEIVDIATRSCDHFNHAALALAAGKHVIIEKPMCATYAEAQRLQVIAASARGRLFVRHNRRFEPGFQHVREIFASGVLGTIHEVKLRRVGFQRRDDWQTIKEFGGGQLLNWGPHIIDHALHLLEAPVAQQWSNLQLVTALGDAEDHLKIVLTGTNGRVVDLEISGGAAISEPEYLVWGSRGALTCHGDKLTLKYLDPARLPSPGAANPATPPRGGAFGNTEPLYWVEQSLPVKPALAVDMSLSFWKCVHATLREAADFPITVAQSVAVMAVVAAAKRGTRFE